jgi:hypothetical protein
VDDEPAPLPACSPDQLAACSATDLVRLLIRNEDRVPRELVDECARRGDAMLDLLQDVLAKDYYWEDDQSSGEWWLRLHAVLILGLVPQERAGELLLAYMCKIEETEDGDLQDWLAGCWPALVRNKPATVVAGLRALGEARDRSWYIRVDAIDAALAYAQIQGEEALSESIAWAARIAFDPDEDFDVRTLTGSALLDFARPEHRADLDRLADLQPHIGRVFGRDEVEKTYAAGGHEPDWVRFDDPWKFYAPEEIEKRRLRWAEEALGEEAESLYEPGETYVRPGPKIGRNDPCPCGSGKKYKKCCMPET